MIFKKGYQPRTNIVWDEKRDLFTGSHIILARWRKHFSCSMLVMLGRLKNTQQNRIKQVIVQFAPRFINLSILFGMGRNYIRSGRVIKQCSNCRSISLLSTVYKMLYTTSYCQG